jgi:hypothetical protein
VTTLRPPTRAQVRVSTGCSRRWRRSPHTGTRCCAGRERGSARS